ncbi:hypothetical protein HY994_01155 [Candidatus Micrarchaeota archaeon]|nr:hypothetical protein [Candidatus Micrarchaeota archaeon]
MNKTYFLISILLLSTVVFALDPTDKFNYAGYRTLALKHLYLEQQYWDDLDQKDNKIAESVLAADNLLHFRTKGGVWVNKPGQQNDLHSESYLAVSGIIRCLESDKAKTPDGLKEIMRSFITPDAGSRNDYGELGLDCVDDVAMKVPARQLATNSMNLYQRVNPKDIDQSQGDLNYESTSYYYGNPVVSGLFELYIKKLKPSRSVYEETIDNHFLRLTKIKDVPLSVALDAFTHLKYRFLTSPALYPYLEETALSADDRAGIHLLAVCIKDNAPLGSVSAYAIRGEVPSIELLSSPSTRCLRTDPRRHDGQSLLIDNSFDLLKTNFMRLSRAVMGTNVLLHRDYPDIPSIARDVMFYDGVKNAHLTPDPKVRKRAIDEIYAVDRFVNVKIRGMRADFDQADSFKGSYYFLDDEEKIVLTSVFENKWKATHQDLIKADSNSKQINEVVQGLGQCAYDQAIDQFSLSGQAPIILGLANKIPYVRSLAIAVNVGIGANMLFESYQSAPELLKYFEKYPTNREQIAEACNNGASIVQNVYQAGQIAHGTLEVGKDFSWKDRISLADEYGAIKNGIKPPEPPINGPSGLKASDGRAQPDTVGLSQAAPFVDQASSKEGRTTLAEHAADAFFSMATRKKTDVPSVAARETVKRVAYEQGVYIVPPVVADAIKVIKEKKDKLTKVETENPGSIEHKMANEALANAIKETIARIREVTCDCDLLLVREPDGAYLQVQVSNAPDSHTVSKQVANEQEAFEKALKEAGVGIKFDTMDGHKIHPLPELLNHFSDGFKAEKDFQLLRRLIHPEILAGGGTHVEARLAELRVKSGRAVLEHSSVYLKPVLEAALKAADSPAEFQKVREQFQAKRDELNAQKADWDEASALKLMAAMDPELPKTFADFAKDDGAFILSNISPEGYRRMAEKNPKFLDLATDKTTEEYAKAKQKIDIEVAAVQNGLMPVFALAKMPIVLETTPGTPVLEPNVLDFFGKYSKPKPDNSDAFKQFEARQTVLSQFNEKLAADFKAARDSYDGEPMDVRPQVMGAGAERTAFLVSAGEVGGNDVPVIVKTGKELFTKDNIRKQIGSYTEADVNRIVEAQRVLTKVDSDPKLMLEHLQDNTFNPKPDSIRAISSRIFNEHFDSESGFSIQIQEYTPGKTARSFRGKATVDELHAAAFDEGRSAAMRALTTANLKEGVIESVVTLMDRENNENYDPVKRTVKLFDVSLGQLHELPPEVSLLYEMLLHDFEFGKRADYEVLSNFLDGYRSGFEDVNRADESNRILGKALQKSREYEENPGLSMTDFHPPDVWLGYGHAIYTSATGDFEQASIMARVSEQTYAKDGIEAQPKVYERNRENLEKYLKEKPVPAEEPTTPSDQQATPVFFKGSLDEARTLPAESFLPKNAPDGKPLNMQMDPTELKQSILAQMADLQPFDSPKPHIIMVHDSMSENKFQNFYPLRVSKIDSKFSVEPAFAQHWEIDGKTEVIGVLKNILIGGFNAQRQPNVKIPVEPGLDFEYYNSGRATLSKQPETLGDALNFEFSAPVRTTDAVGINTEYQIENNFIGKADPNQIYRVNVAFKPGLTPAEIIAHKSYYHQQFNGVRFEFYQNGKKI